jgi:hypothetical protein
MTDDELKQLAFNSSLVIPHSSFISDWSRGDTRQSEFSDCFIDDQHKTARHKIKG